MTETLNKILDENASREKTANYNLRRSLAVGALGATLLSGFGIYKAAEAAIDHLANPIEYSNSTTSYTTESNDGLLAIASHVDGIETVDQREVANHIRSMPENADAFADGIQIHETFVIPTEVKSR